MKKEIEESLRRQHGLPEADDLGDFLGDERPDVKPNQPGGFVSVDGKPPPTGTVREIMRSFGLSTEEIEEWAEEMDQALDRFRIPRDQKFTLYQGPDFEQWEDYEEFLRQALGSKKDNYDPYGMGGFYLHDNGINSTEGEGAAWIFA